MQPDPGPERVLGFWFGAAADASEVAATQHKLWFGKSRANDTAVAEQFAPTLAEAAAGRLEHWAASPRGRLALIIVLDQFPHHVYRDQPQAFATDDAALRHALAALDLGEDLQLTPIERVFLYLPLEHAESLALQARAVHLYERLAHDALPQERPLFEGFLDYARRHRDVIARFGRFPHRNAILGRNSSGEEIEFLKQPGSRF